MQATSLMQKYEKLAEMYQLPREGRFLVKNDYGVVSNSKKQNYGGRKLNRMIGKSCVCFYIMAKFLITTS